MTQSPMPPQGSYQLPPQGNYQMPTNQQATGSKAKALLIGLGALVLGAIAWGLLAYFTDKIFFYVAILIGMGISYAMISPFRKPVSKSILFSLVVPAILFTLLSLELGNLISFILTFQRDFDIPLSKSISPAFDFFFSKLWLQSKENILTIVFGVLGAGLGFYNTLKRS
ncbi:hypothetical protein [Herpetosiphon llansteffanensis]|uniref:hypothetical protein n=1 Tax=Herpetosiphon llansteffanensis TaxID=2094568 RepID=UPI000D7B966D|nr:hypothetical protein [Herpetosiphon llansteffanensis]